MPYRRHYNILGRNVEPDIFDVAIIAQNDDDLFDVNKVLPLEVINDWFDVAPEPISVKNRHLINITKPIGINTIGSSLKIATHDIRGTPSQPKNIVAPWLLSSIQPDINLKPLF
jgi:hypothetical protein